MAIKIAVDPSVAKERIWRDQPALRLGMWLVDEINVPEFIVYRLVLQDMRTLEDGPGARSASC